MVAQVDRAYLGYGLGRMARRLVSYALFEGFADMNEPLLANYKVYKLSLKPPREIMQGS